MPDEMKRKSLRQLSGAVPHPDDLPAIVEEIRQASDRTAAIVLASCVERSLEQLIIRALPRRDDQTVKKLLERDGPVESFYGKNYLGYALALYDETTLNNLEGIRRIRNAFAHSAVQIHFETEQIIDEVRKLRPGRFGTGTELAEFSEYRRKFTEVCTRFMSSTGLTRGASSPKSATTPSAAR